MVKKIFTKKIFCLTRGGRGLKTSLKKRTSFVKSPLSREDEAHLTSEQCTVYGDLALKYSDLTDDQNLVEFFREVLDRMDQLDQE